MSTSPKARKKPRQPFRGDRTKILADAAQRDKQAFQLKLAGASNRRIADELFNGNETNVSRSLSRQFKRISPSQEEVEQFRAIEQERLEADRFALEQRLAKVLANTEISDLTKLTAMCKALDAKTRIMVRRAKMLGLDVPEPLIHVGVNGGPVEILDVTKLTDDQLEKLARGFLPTSAPSSGAGTPPPDANGGANGAGPNSTH